MSDIDELKEKLEASQKLLEKAYEFIHALPRVPFDVPTWVEEDSYKAQVQMRLDVAKRLQYKIDEFFELPVITKGDG